MNVNILSGVRSASGVRRHCTRLSQTLLLCFPTWLYLMLLPRPTAISAEKSCWPYDWDWSAYILHACRGRWYAKSSSTCRLSYYFFSKLDGIRRRTGRRVCDLDLCTYDLENLTSSRFDCGKYSCWLNFGSNLLSGSGAIAFTGFPCAAPPELWLTPRTVKRHRCRQYLLISNCDELR